LRSIPLYSIDRFIKQPQKRLYEIEVFDKHRDFKVTYPHRHDFYEILFITQGSGIHHIDFKDYVIKVNSLFFLSPGQIHSLSLSDDIRGYIFLFTSEFYLLNKNDQNKLLELPFFYSISNENPPLYLDNKEEAGFLMDLFRQASQENALNKEESPELIRSFLDIILLKCKRLYPLGSREVKMNKGKLLAKKFKQLIEEKYQENISIRDYASLLSVTPNHLNETVKNVTGLTATHLLSDKIIMEIKRMLIHTELSVSEIAIDFNFSDQSYFSKYFRTRTGMSPGEFRKNSIKTT
jgi:AraC family transcriptional activator of pobA